MLLKLSAGVEVTAPISIPTFKVTQIFLQNTIRIMIPSEMHFKSIPTAVHAQVQLKHSLLESSYLGYLLRSPGRAKFAE